MEEGEREREAIQEVSPTGLHLQNGRTACKPRRATGWRWVTRNVCEASPSVMLFLKKRSMASKVKRRRRKGLWLAAL